MLSYCRKQNNGSPKMPTYHCLESVNTLPCMAKNFCRCDLGYEFEMERLSWITWVDSIKSRESLKAENLSLLWPEREVTTEKRSERCDVASVDTEEGNH